ncbi:MAG: hypothetical protein GXP54_03420, partial [Deltaproteobacteria bacterium]|nr:hypothetical protein [Deltaproteobacteria bacterium]
MKTDLELALLEDGGKQVLKKDLQPGSSSERLVEMYRSRGLAARVVGESDERGINPAPDPASWSSPDRFVLASPDTQTLDEAVELALIEMDPSGDSMRRSAARERLGKLLGYPPCCCAFYSDLEARDDAEAFHAAFRGTSGRISGHNLFTGLHAISVISHSPCSFACRPSRDLSMRILKILGAVSPEGRDAFEYLCSLPLLYMDASRRFLLQGVMDDEGAVRYSNVHPAHFVTGRDATDVAMLRLLKSGDRLSLTPARLKVWKGRRLVWNLDLRSSLRLPLLLSPGRALSNRRIRVALVESSLPDAHDLFGNMRLSLMAGDLKTNGHVVRNYAVETGPEGIDSPTCDALAQDLADQGIHVIVFYRFAPGQLVASIRRALPNARLLLTESGLPFGESGGIRIVETGRLALPRLIDAMSADAGPPPTVEPVMYAPFDQPFAPDLHRRRVRPSLLSSGPLKHWEVLGRLSCPYRRHVASNPCFEGVDLDVDGVHARGCSMCSFRTKGPTRKGPTRIDAADWSEAIRRQIAWIRRRNKGADHFRIVDHFGLQHLGTLLERLSFHGPKGLTLLLDARADHILGRNAGWKSLIESARASKTRLDFTCVGFESFSQPELDRFNKGVSVARNVAAARRIRRLWEQAPDVFVHEHKGAGFITWTPWTSLDDLKENVGYFRELGFTDFRSELAALRLRLYPDLPLYHLARRDGLLLDSRPPDWEPASGYSPDHPWRFASTDTAKAHALVRRLLAEIGEPGHDVEVLDMAIRLVGDRGYTQSRRSSGIEDAKPLDDSDADQIAEFVARVAEDGRFARAARRLIAWRDPRRVFLEFELAEDSKAPIFCCEYAVERSDHATEWIGAIRELGSIMGHPDQSFSGRDAIFRLLDDAQATLDGIALEVCVPRTQDHGFKDGGFIRLSGSFKKDKGYAAHAVLRSVGIDAAAYPEGLLKKRLVKLSLELSLRGTVKAGIFLEMDRKRPSIMARLCTTPAGPLLFSESDLIMFEIAVDRPDRGRFHFLADGDRTIKKAFALLESPGFSQS